MNLPRYNLVALFICLLALLLVVPVAAQTTYAWGGGFGNWDDPGNWAPNGVPGASDTAIVGTPGITIATLTANTTVAGLEIKELGAISGNFDLTVTEAMIWSGGGNGFETFRGSGLITISPGATLNIIEPITRFVLSDGRTVVNNGLILWEGSGTWEGNGRLVNNGELVLAFDESGPLGVVFSSRTDAFTNSVTGLIRRTGSGEALLQAGFHNNGVVRVENGTLNLFGFNSIGGTDTGLYEVEEGARLVFRGGNRTLTNTVEISGTGTIQIGGGIGMLTNNATWKPGDSPGVLPVDSDYAAGNSTLEVEIGGLAAGTDYDQLDVADAATLGGTLQVVLTGGFVPQDGDRFLIVPAVNGATGAFATVDLPAGLDAFVETSALGAELVIGTPVANEGGSDMPQAFALHSAYPNPFNPQATVGFDVPEAGEVRLALFDALGREVAVLVDGLWVAGHHTTQIDGRGLASGLYLVRMTTSDGFAGTRRITLLK